VADFHVFADIETLSRATADLFLDRARRSVAERGRFIIALPGGSTPVRLFTILARDPYRQAVPWGRTLVFWGDDRAVPPDHEHANYRLARDTLLSRVPVPEENVMRVRGELGAAGAAGIMRSQLAGVFGEHTLPRFDFIIQGIGTDGHTASLFPGTDALDSMDWVAPVPAPPVSPALDRVTLTLPVLNNARTALFLVAGAAKRALLNEIMTDPTAPDRFPAARLNAAETLWYVDRAAFGRAVR